MSLVAGCGCIVMKSLMVANLAADDGGRGGRSTFIFEAIHFKPPLSNDDGWSAIFT